MSGKFYWPGLSVDVEQYVNHCNVCIKFSSVRHGLSWSSSTCLSSDCVPFHDDNAPLSNPTPNFDMVESISPTDNIASNSEITIVPVIAEEPPLVPTEDNPVVTVVAPT